MKARIVNPPALGAPSGFNHGILPPAGGRMLFVAGQPGLDGAGKIAAPGFVEQFDAAMARVVAVVREAGGEPGHIGRLTIYVTNLAEYRRSLAPLGDAWRRHMGRHYPAVALVEVKGLVDEGAVVEIEATAVLPAGSAEPGGAS
jgi:enamine deaminase RidA (YjgF/YER057c/UK114 family)